MRRTRAVVGLVLLASVLSAFGVAAAWGAAQPPGAGEDPGGALRVATREAPPFSYRGPDGVWRGISIEAWQAVAEQSGLAYELVELDVPAMLAALEDRTVDVAAAALTMTAEREESVDFSLPILQSGLGVAARAGADPGLLQVARGLLSFEFLQVLLGLFVVLLLAGCLVWLFERRANSEQFGGSAHHGLGSGIWWAAVTMTTVGYGDKAPATLGGRIVALVWMFTSLVVIGGFLASMASSLTLGGIDSRIETADDLNGLRVAVVEGTLSEQYARVRLLQIRPEATVELALRAVESKRADAAIHDRPILRYTVSQGDHPDVEVLPLQLSEDYYGLAFPQGSELREAFNRALLGLWESGQLEVLRRRYLDLGGQEE